MVKSKRNHPSTSKGRSSPRPRQYRRTAIALRLRRSAARMTTRDRIRTIAASLVVIVAFALCAAPAWMQVGR